MSNIRHPQVAKCEYCKYWKSVSVNWNHCAKGLLTYRDNKCCKRAEKREEFSNLKVYH